MKNLLKIFSVLSLLAIVISCNESDDFTYLTPEANFSIISPSENAALLLDSENPNNNALTVVWEDNISGAESYTVELSLDEEFSQPYTLGTSSSNTLTLTVAELNAMLLEYNISALEETEVFLRIIGGESISETLKMFISSYPENNPVITNPDSTFEIVLSDITEDEVATTIEWTDPDFSENTSVAINYFIEASIAGTEFATIESLGNTGDRSLELTHGQLNASALNLGLTVDEAGSMDIRVRAALETASGTLERISEFITITVTPYETALPPTLYGVGAGMPDAGWVWDSPIEFALQGTTYSGNVNLSPDNGGNFRFFAQQDWGPDSFNYTYYQTRGYTIDENLVNANDNDNNFQFIGTAGEYFLEIDTENKTITLGPPVSGPNCEYDQLWIVGAGVPDAGWVWDSPVQLPCTGNGVYSGNVTLQNNSGIDNNFRFFAQQDWGPDSFNYPYYSDNGYTIDSNLVNANDGDSNFAFVGTTGEYFLTIDTINKTITLGAAQVNCEFDQLWLVGAGVPDAGWVWDTPVELPCIGGGVYSAEITLANDAFRFFTTNGDWTSGRNYPYYENEGYTIDANFENAGDGDNNFSFIGTPGTYTLTMDTVNKTITIQ
ncbi:SusE domain-containing protein [Mangrovimonas cancribranchiae]|uniref:SusE domain-containing protein n=1 Tax=Mangrovimonas cancribranchiae TaxID=3080055 RepID=A0AAU6P829_9FLAO